MPHVQQATAEGVASDVQAGVAHLRTLGVEKVFTLGFYGRSTHPSPVVAQMTAPLLMLVAGADAGIPVEDPIVQRHS